ncbi:3-ketoacyl-CoA synthase 19 [Monoraphidium neglectum]|uniref:3-ketoacyl-CoA synthase 19 n=1 Tax=Monoraphidium neglectum TaxID=145388 RepID=A0A0D2MFH6_9CHLO|nr:3-ketoacyl-CoA synthase 19 [Monoraphidium neglectum]KIZ01890.1 3-ketoacyl-CoA synthase 19 [Monoraphidium neglectum]|eukprot:XP_013900909.1 3-ketoacyl-CoA synthase 19 [Monoraphidium neglectum]
MAQAGNDSIKSLKRVVNAISRNAGTLVAVPAAAVLAYRLNELWKAGELEQLLRTYLDTRVNVSLVRKARQAYIRARRPVAMQAGQAAQAVADAITVAVVAAVGLLAVLLLRLLFPSERPTYLVDFSVHKGQEEWKFPKEWFLPHSARVGKGRFTEDDLDFQEKILMRSGLGDETYIPPWLYSNPPHYDMEHARKEFEVCCFSAVRDLLNKTGVSPKQIGFVITNCSLFNPTPSLSATIMHHFGMGASTLNYNLGGMGCSAGVVAIDLARQMLQIYPNSYALVVSHENLTSNWYPGSDRSMLVPNCIFRSNGAAILLSNRSSESW